MKKPRLIDNARSAWRMLSVQAMTLATAVQSAWLAVPPELQARLSPELVHGITIALLIAGIIGRLVKQDAVQP